MHSSNYCPGQDCQLLLALKGKLYSFVVCNLFQLYNCVMLSNEWRKRLWSLPLLFFGINDGFLQVLSKKVWIAIFVDVINDEWQNI